MLSANWNLNRYCNIFIEILKLCSSYKYTYPSLLQAMDSNEINKFAKRLGIKDFIGVFAVDELTLIPKSRTGLLIFNTDTAENIGQHWIALCVTKNNIYYFDSLSGSFQHSIHFEEYIKFVKKRLTWNTIQIQHNVSDKCGIHCLVFCYAMRKKRNRTNFERFLNNFLNLSIENREHLSLELFRLIKTICCL